MSPYILRSIDENPTGRPIYGQLVGHEPEYLARDALALMEHDCAGVDLNMGCPAPMVCRRNAGGGMLRSLKAMDAALGALRDVLPAGAFTVKCRLGYENPDEFERILPVIAAHTPDRVCIHARTVREGYRSPVHPEWVKGRGSAGLSGGRQRQHCGCGHGGRVGAAGPARRPDDRARGPAQSMDIFPASRPFPG